MLMSDICICRWRDRQGAMAEVDKDVDIRPVVESIEIIILQLFWMIQTLWVGFLKKSRWDIMADHDFPFL